MEHNLRPEFLAQYSAMARPGGHKHHSAIRNPQPKVFEHKLFQRLYWPLWEPLSNVKVLADESLTSGDDIPLQWQPLFDDTLRPAHALGQLPATNPELSRMRVEIATIHDNDWWQDSCLMDQRPAALVLDNSGESDRPITIAQLVREVAAYLETQPLQAAYKEIFCSPQRTDHVLQQSADRAFFNGCTGPKRSQITKITGDDDGRGETAPLFRLKFIWGWDENRMDNHWADVRRRLLHSSDSTDLAIV